MPRWQASTGTNRPDAMLLRQHETFFEDGRGRRRVAPAELQPAAAIGSRDAVIGTARLLRDRGGLLLELLGDDRAHP